jgi:FkbM family methyltransferase
MLEGTDVGYQMLLICGSSSSKWWLIEIGKDQAQQLFGLLVPPSIYLILVENRCTHVNLACGGAQMDRAIFINTGLGVYIQRLRERIDLIKASLSAPENVATISNDMISRYLLERICKPGGVFVDVGAHIGSVVDGVRRHSQPSAIVAIEAMPDKAQALRRKFPDITTHACAVGEQDGTAPFFIDVSRTGYSSLYSTTVRNAGVREITVPICRLDGLIPTGMVDLIKIDVEGGELGVLKGAQALVERSQPIIMFESGPEERGDYTKEGIFNWFNRLQYAILVPNRVAHIDDGLSLLSFVEAHLYPRRTTNYFAIPRSRRNEARDRARKVLRIR